MLLSLELSKVSLVLWRLHSLLFNQRNLLSQDFVLLTINIIINWLSVVLKNSHLLHCWTEFYCLYFLDHDLTIWPVLESRVGRQLL